MGWKSNLWNSQFHYTPPYPTEKFTGQTIIVTGSNCGLGLEAARHFVRLDAAKVILAVRNLGKGETAKASIEASEHHRPADVIEVWELDLARNESVKQFARRAEGLERLDVVVANAGIVTGKFTMMEGDESTIKTNVLSTFLLALLVLPKLRETAGKFNVLPRLVIVASFTHYQTNFEESKNEDIFASLNVEDTANMEDRYYITKLMEVFVVRELSKLMDASASSESGRVVLNCLNPGWCYSEVMREMTGAPLLAFKAARALVARSTEVGSRTLISAAEGGVETHGQYLDDCHVGGVSPLVSSEEGAQIQKRVWTQLAQKLEAIQPGILQNI